MQPPWEYGHRQTHVSTLPALSYTGRCQVSLSTDPPSPPPQAHTTAKLIAGVGTVRVAIAEPRAWDTGTAQRAAQLSLRAGLVPAVENILVDAIRAVIDAVTRAGAASGWLALSVLGTWLSTWGTG